MIEKSLTKCAICGTYDNSQVVLKSNLDDKSFSTEVFSARRIPDRRYYQWVKCSECGLLRSDPIREIALDELYKKSKFDYGFEIQGLKKTYMKLLSKSGFSDKTSAKILEIGGGNGFFLDAVLDKFPEAKVVGVEPSLDAVEKSSERVRPFMIASMMNSKLFANSTFNYACIFHVLDHLPDPDVTLSQIYDSLESQGVVVIAVHNSKSWSARLFKEKSPIFDVEHTYLYDKKTLSKILEKSNFNLVRISSYSNKYSLLYLLQLSPIPSGIKLKAMNSSVISNLLKNIRITFPLGNIVAIGRKS